jgi:murein tripeptide amidase MpaA
VETSLLTHTLAGMDVPMLTITDFSHSKQEEQKKKIVVITGRVHPGETNSSWIVHGIIKFLLSKDKVAIELRKRLVFKVIPMINSDGVVAGNSRCSFIGRDVNRMFGPTTN